MNISSCQILVGALYTTLQEANNAFDTGHLRPPVLNECIARI